MKSRWPFPGVPRAAWLVLAAAVLMVGGPLACSPGASEEGALLRGDEAFARGDYADALAEYRLALSRGSEDVNALMRTAHAFLQVGRVVDARQYYEMAIEQDEDLRDQAVADLIRRARTAAARGDRLGAATAIQAAVELEPGVSVEDLALPLARHFSRGGQYAEALPFFQKALASGSAEEDPLVLYEVAMAHEELGDCERALYFFEAFREEGTQAQRDEADWHIGRCSFELGRQALSEEEPRSAADYLRTTVELGEPRHLLAQAYFELGEALAAAGDCVAAVQAFEEAQREDLGGSPALTQRARERVDDIRFRGPGDPESGC